MPTSTPPFRAEHIGSLLRPRSLLELRRRHVAGAADAEEMRRAEDDAIRAAVRLQERAGLAMITDGELRRRQYHSAFFGALGDITIAVPDGAGSAGARGAQPVARIGSRVRWTQPVHVDDFRFLAGLTSATPKVTLPGPCALHFRGGDAVVLAHAYHSVDQFWEDIVEAYGRELSALAAAGCRYVQIDETAFAKFSDPAVQATLTARGEDWRATIDLYIGLTNRILAAAPEGLAIGMHLCRGNRGGQHHAEGGYDAVADKLFNELAIAFYLLEYDSPRAGDFSPLRLLPKGKRVVLGLVSTKTGVLESRADIIRRIEQAARIVDLDRLALSPQCGFASIDTGNPLSEAEQEAKLRRVVDVAAQVWGE